MLAEACKPSLDSPRCWVEPGTLDCDCQGRVVLSFIIQEADQQVPQAALCRLFLERFLYDIDAFIYGSQLLS
jgi:hypothetical protein